MADTSAPSVAVRYRARANGEGKQSLCNGVARQSFATSGDGRGAGSGERGAGSGEQSA